MRRSLLLIICVGAAVTAAMAKDLRLRVVNETDRRPVAYASIAVEYPDTIVSYESDRRGRLSFTPASFPITVTARAAGMVDSTIGLVSMTEKKVVIEMSPDPDAVRPVVRKRPDWSSDRRPRLSSVFVVRSSSPK